jgi:CheY-like chemotaxis protein
MGGTLDVKSEPGVGSTFFFEIWLETCEKPVSHSNNDTAIQKDTLKGKRILLVEDNELNRIIANGFVTGWGADVVNADDGKKAVSLVQSQQFDLILMDIQMPEMDGYEATRIIRSSEDDTIRQIPIIALTASVFSDVKKKIQSCGMNDFAMKPIEPAVLLEKIKENINP